MVRNKPKIFIKVRHEPDPKSPDRFKTLPQIKGLILIPIIQPRKSLITEQNYFIYKLTNSNYIITHEERNFKLTRVITNFFLNWKHFYNAILPK